MWEECHLQLKYQRRRKCSGFRLLWTIWIKQLRQATAVHRLQLSVQPSKFITRFQELHIYLLPIAIGSLTWLPHYRPRSVWIGNIISPTINAGAPQGPCFTLFTCECVAKLNYNYIYKVSNDINHWWRVSRQERDRTCGWVVQLQ